MKAREELLEGLDKQAIPFDYVFPNQRRVFGKRKFRFLLKPLFSTDFWDEKMGKEALKEMGNGQTEQEAARVVAQKFKDKIVSMDEDSLGKMILQRAVVYPKIVDKKENLKDDEVPFSFIMKWEDLKFKLVKKIQEISPIFAEG